MPPLAKYLLCYLQGIKPFSFKNVLVVPTPQSFPTWLYIFYVLWQINILTWCTLEFDKTKKYLILGVLNQYEIKNAARIVMIKKQLRVRPWAFTKKTKPNQTKMNPELISETFISLPFDSSPRNSMFEDHGAFWVYSES